MNCIKLLRTRLAASTITLREVTSLDHKLLDNTVESGALIAKTLLAGSKSTKVLSSLWDGLAVKAHYDAAKRLIAMLDVEIDLIGNLGTLGGLGRLCKAEQDAEDDGYHHSKPAKFEHYQ